MTRSKMRLKALGACALAFCLMAVWTGVAQAEETGGKWAYIGKTTGEELRTFEGALGEPEISAEVDVSLVLHSEFLEGTKILYECKTLQTAAGSKLKANGVLLGQLIFSECTTRLNGVLSEACKPKEGKVTTNLIKAQMVLHNLEGGAKDKILIVEGETAAGEAANLAIIASTASCSLGANVNVGGKIALELSNATTHEVKHLFKEFAPLTTLWIINNTAEHRANILGSGWAFLAGIHAGLKFAGLWNEVGTGGSWTYTVQVAKEGELKTFEGALAEPEIGGEADTTFILHSEALEGTKVLYECKKVSAAAGSKLKANGVALGKLTFTECLAFLNGVESIPCKPVEGKVTTNLIKAQMLLHKLAGGTIDKILIAEGETEAGGAANFATIQSTAGCALGIKVPVGGKIALEPSNLTHEVKHLVDEFPPLTALWILSNTAEHKASLLGSGWAFLTGAHTGFKWTGLWN